VLFEHARVIAAGLGVERLRIEADPGAEPFYLRMGMVRSGSIASGSIPARTLP